MIHRRTKLSIAIVVVVLLLLGGAIYLRKQAPPEAARLLPESDGIVYINLRPLRAATHFDQHPVSHSPDYQKFIDATGIEFERDLDDAAFALHRMSDPTGPNGAVAFSEVFSGHFDGRRLMGYLATLAASQEDYAGHTIYDIPSEGRTVRVTLLGYDVVAVSNAPSTEQIHSMVDRYRTAALPFAGSSLLSKHYAQVPLLSVAWGIGQIALPLGKNGGVRVMGLTLPVPLDATLIASLTWVGRIHLRVEEIAPTDAAAADTTESLQTILTLLKSLQSSGGNTPIDPQMQTVVNSVTVERHGNKAVVTATIPSELVQHVLASPQEMSALPLAGRETPTPATQKVSPPVAAASGKHAPRRAQP
ncbi:MAG TPA: hypothetical protein VHX60_11960 [Acidobacteriaceae bacterium]|jgi:hypothetical protein|nr:hypothetical protein [Acidobacteriaceae bacterium]